METITACRVCQGKDIAGFFDLGKQPLANSLPARPDEKENVYPLSLSFCPNCRLVQLNETIEPEKLFSQYVWVTGTSRTAQEYAEAFYREIVARTENPRQGYVLEVASNDGTFLAPFIRDGFTVLGIDPADNIAAVARGRGIPTESTFFGAEAASRIAAQHGPARIVFARHVLPHVAKTRDFVEGLHACLDDDGTLAVEVHYAKTIQVELHYDSIYHEHLCYFTLESLERLLNNFGLYVFDLMQGPISGGALVVYARKKKTPQHARVEELRAAEKASGTNEFASWKEFAQQSFAHRDKLLSLLREAKGAGKTIVAWGASARSSTMLNFCGVGTDLVESIIDLNPFKQGRFTAGTHIPIMKPEQALAAHPGVIFITAWNFRNEIMETLKQKFGFRGECIIPLPNEPRVAEV